MTIGGQTMAIRRRHRKCQHHWAGWWIVGDEATNECLWCKAKWTERLAVPMSLRPLRRHRT